MVLKDHFNLQIPQRDTLKWPPKEQLPFVKKHNDKSAGNLWARLHLGWCPALTSKDTEIHQDVKQNFTLSGGKGMKRKRNIRKWGKVRNLTSLSKYHPLSVGWDPALNTSLATPGTGFAPCMARLQSSAPMLSVLALRPTTPEELPPSDQLMGW